MHKSYEKIQKHKADFRVSYSFRSPEEGGRQTGEPYQGIRSVFSIEGEEENVLYRIHPEFEDEDGELILFNDRSVPKSGTARMWISFPQSRPIHYNKIFLGLKCYFREGPHFTADCEVIEMLDLAINPIE